MSEAEELIRFYHNCYRDTAEAAKKYLPEATPRIRKTLTGYIRGCEKYMDCQDPDDCDIQLIFLHATAKTLTRPKSPRSREEQEIIEALPFDAEAPEALKGTPSHQSTKYFKTELLPYKLTLN